MNKRAVVSFANSKNNYVKGMERLNESLRHNSDGIDFLGFVNEATVGAPLHTDNPYAFKIYCIKKVVDAGYTSVLWLDSSCFAIKPIYPIFDEIEKNGMMYQDGGHFVSTWTNNTTLEYFGVTREETSAWKTIGNAGLLGFDFTNPIAIEFFKRWEDSMLAGCFIGSWTNENNTESESDICRGHRHDLSCSSIIVHQMGLDHLMKRGDEWLAYAGLYDVTPNDTIIIKAQGL